MICGEEMKLGVELRGGWLPLGAVGTACRDLGTGETPSITTSLQIPQPCVPRAQLIPLVPPPEPQILLPPPISSLHR